MANARVRILYFSTWADGVEQTGHYLHGLPDRDLTDRVSDPADPELMRLACLDRDWDAECLRALSMMAAPGLEVESAWVADARGVLEFLSASSCGPARAWLILIDQKPTLVAPVIGRLLAAFTSRGGRVLYWAYDDASRTMECFAGSVASYLSVLIHDEWPLHEPVRQALPRSCRTVHSSFVANIVPFAVPFSEEVEERLVFLGSGLGLTAQRREQFRALEAHFGERFTCITDHSVPVRERARFARIKVHVCPEGRKFDTPTMSRSHTDRPFWAGCLGQIPVSEDSRGGGRLRGLVDAGLVLSYAHASTAALIEQCERALDAGPEMRRRVYEHFNRHGVIGSVAAREIAAFEAAWP